MTPHTADLARCLVRHKHTLGRQTTMYINSIENLNSQTWFPNAVLFSTSGMRGNEKLYWMGVDHLSSGKYKRNNKAFGNQVWESRFSMLLMYVVVCLPYICLCLSKHGAVCWVFWFWTQRHWPWLSRAPSEHVGWAKNNQQNKKQLPCLTVLSANKSK